MADEIKIKVTADTADFEKGMESAQKTVEETGDQADESKSKWKKLSDQLSQVSPTFKKMSDSWSETSQKIDANFGKNTAASKLFKLGVVGALAAIAVKAAGTAAKFAAETAKMFDPKGYSKASGQMQNSIKKLKTTIGSFTAPIVNGMMTVFSKIIDGITWVLEKLRMWYAFLEGILSVLLKPIADAFGQIVSWIKQGVNALSNLLGFGDVFKAPAKSAEDAAESMGEVVEATSAGLASFDKINTLDMSNAGDAEQAEKVSSSIEDAKNFGAELTTKLGDFFANLNPGAIWEGFKEKAGQAWDWVKEKAMGIWNGILEFATGIWNGIKAVAEGIWNAIKAFAEGVWNAILSVATAIWDAIVAIVTTKWEIIKAVATAVWNVIFGVATAIWNTICTVATTIWETIKTVAMTIWTAISEPILAVWNTFKSLGEDAWGALQKLGEKFNEKIIDPIKNAVGWCMEKIEWVLKKIDDAKNFLGNVGGGIVSGAKKMLGLASGGAVAPNNPMPYILGDNTSEYEVVSPVSLMKDAVKSAISEMGGAGGSGGSSGPIELTINLDSRKIARAVYDPLETERKRRGVST